MSFDTLPDDILRRIYASISVCDMASVEIASPRQREAMRRQNVWEDRWERFPNRRRAGEQAANLHGKAAIAHWIACKKTECDEAARSVAQARRALFWAGQASVSSLAGPRFSVRHLADPACTAAMQTLDRAMTRRIQLGTQLAEVGYPAKRASALHGARRYLAACLYKWREAAKMNALAAPKQKRD